MHALNFHLQHSSDRGLVREDPVGAGGGEAEAVMLTKQEHPGTNLLVSRLGEDAVQVEHQQDVLNPWMLPGQHRQLVGVDLQSTDRDGSGGSEDPVLDELPGLRAEDSQHDLVVEEATTGDKEVSGGTEHRMGQNVKTSNFGEFNPVQPPQSSHATNPNEIVGVRERP